MTVQSSSLRADYPGNDVADTFTVPFYFLADSHLLVLFTTAAGTQIGSLNSDYTVTGAGVSGGGEITTVAAIPTGMTVSILQNPPISQLTHYVEGDPFPAASHENALDLLTIISLMHDEQISRSLRAPRQSPNFDGTLSSLVPGELLGVNMAGTGFESKAAPTGTAVDVLNTLASTAAGQGAERIAVLAPFTGAVATTQAVVNLDRVSVFRWFTWAEIYDVLSGTLTEDVTTKIQDAIDYVIIRGGTLYFPRGYYLISGTLRIGNAIHTPAEVQTIISRTNTDELPSSPENIAARLYNQAHFLPMSLEFETNAVLVAATAWTPSVQTAMVEHNLNSVLNNTTFIKGINCVSQACVISGRYIARNIGGTTPVENLIGLLVTGPNLSAIDIADFAGLGSGLVAISPYWTRLSNVHAQYCGDGVHWSGGNASRVENVRLEECSRGIIIDGAAMAVNGVHTEQVLDDFICLSCETSSFSNFYLEDVSSSDGTGHSAVTLGQDVANACIHSTFTGIRVSGVRSGKSGYTIEQGVKACTFIDCRGYSSTITASASSTGTVIGGDLSLRTALLGNGWGYIGDFINYNSVLTVTNVATSSVGGNCVVNGHLAHCQVRIVLSDAPTGVITATLPIPPNNNLYAVSVGEAVAQRSSDGNYFKGIVWLDSANALVKIHGVPSGGDWGPSQPIAWASGDVIHLNFDYFV